MMTRQKRLLSRYLHVCEI
uniref:Uncharacterized protein n=1 Tax=Anguilla anguilla TaxID=7936 RepID=A0A0E9W3U4_ANGAN